MRPFDRHITPVISRLLRAFRVVVISGPRQAGKTTLLGLVPEIGADHTVSFDRPDVLERALDDPLGFVGGFEAPLAIDEFQRAGDDVLLAIKYLVDRSDDRGQFVLAGSTNFLANRRLSETLAGRVGLADVLPLSRGEILGVREQFIDRAFEGADAVLAAAGDAEDLDRAQLVEHIAMGGFPEVVRISDERDRMAFFRAYVDTVTGREALADVGAARARSELRRVTGLVAARTSAEYHPTSLAGDADLTRQTIASYVELLRALHLLVLLPGWANNATTRAKRAPKLHMVDSGLATAVCGEREAALRRPDNRLFGALLETYVTVELLKARAWAETPVDALHFRDREGREVDLVLEADDGRIVAIEVKAASNVGPKAFEHLRYLRDRLGDRLVAGIVLTGGREAWRYSDGLVSVPISTLWAP